MYFLNIISDPPNAMAEASYTRLPLTMDGPLVQSYVDLFPECHSISRSILFVVENKTGGLPLFTT